MKSYVRDMRGFWKPCSQACTDDGQNLHDPRNTTTPKSPRVFGVVQDL